MSKNKSDILFLEKRLELLVKNEQYEIAARVKKWIDELRLKREKEYQYSN